MEKERKKILALLYVLLAVLCVLLVVAVGLPKEQPDPTQPSQGGNLNIQDETNALDVADPTGTIPGGTVPAVTEPVETVPATTEQSGTQPVQTEPVATQPGLNIEGEGEGDLTGEGGNVSPSIGVEDDPQPTQPPRPTRPTEPVQTTEPTEEEGEGDPEVTEPAQTTPNQPQQTTPNQPEETTAPTEPQETTKPATPTEGEDDFVIDFDDLLNAGRNP